MREQVSISTSATFWATLTHGFESPTLIITGTNFMGEINEAQGWLICSRSSAMKCQGQDSTQTFSPSPERFPEPSKLRQHLLAGPLG